MNPLQAQPTSRLLPAQRDRIHAALVNAIKAVVWEADPITFQFIFVSPHAERLLGYAIAEWLEDPDFWRNHTHPDDVERCSRLCREATAQGQDHEFEYRMYAADGQIVWLRDIVTVVPGAEGAPERLCGVMIDISELKRAEEQARLHERCLAAIAEGILITAPNQPDNAILYANAAFERLTGYAAEEVLGRNCRFLQGADTDRAAVAEMRAAIVAGRAFSGELLNYRKDGTPFWNSLSIAPVLDKSGRVTHFVGVQTDVTERHQYEAELRQREERLQRQEGALLQLSRDVFRGGNPKAAVQHMSEAVAQVLKVERVSVWRYLGDRRGIRCMDLFERSRARHSSGAVLSAENYPAYFRALEESDVIAAAEAQADQRTREFTTDYLIPYRIGAMLDVPLRPFGRLEGVLCCEHVGPARRWTPDEQVFAMAVGNLVSLAQERWEREKVEVSLRASEELFRNMADHAPAIVWVSDPSGRCTYINRLWYEFTGQEEGAALGSGWLEAVHPDDRMLAETGFHSAIVRKSAFRIEYRLRRKDGVYRWHIDSAAPWHAVTGEFLGYIGSAIDFSERREAEEQIRQSQKMDAIGQLAGGMAHDFNNLLTIINGYSDLLLDSLSAADPSREQLEAIRKAGERSASLTRQLLAFSRKQVLAPQMLDLNEVVREVELMLRRVIGEDVLLTIELEPQLGFVRADPGQIEQVLMNLSLNARDAMPRGGELRITTGHADVTMEEMSKAFDASPGRYVTLSVTDTGTGMTPEIHARIFEPFFTTKEQGNGTGLGLAVVHGIVAQSGGFIRVESELGRGATFRVYLPVTDGTRREERGQAAMGTMPEGTETVLLVEDETAVRSLAHYVLSSAGYTLLEAANGEEALRVAAVHQGPIDLLVTDVVMPGMSGRELVERISARDRGIRVLFVSGYTDDAVVRHGVHHAEVAFLQKPFTPAALAHKVREVLDAIPGQC